MFDCAIVGTSPIGLLEAMHRQAAGQKVCLIDREPQVGGAWVSGTQLGLPGVESYCHLIDYDEAGYDALQSLFPGGFFKVRHTPRNLQFSRDGQRLMAHYDYASLRAEMRDWPMALRLTNAKPISWAWEALEWARRTLGGRQHLYPVGGAGRLISRLEKRLQRTDVTCLLGTTLTGVRVSEGGGDGVSLSLVSAAGAGQSLQARELVVTSRSWIPEITVGDRRHVIGDKVRAKIYPHLIIRAQVGRDSPYSYVELRNHRLIRRTQNQSESLRLAGLLPQDQEVHIVHLADEALAGQSGKIIGCLQGLGLFDRSFRPMKVTRNISKMSFIDADALRQVRRLAGGQVSMMWTETLAEAVGRYWPRWQRLAAGLTF